MDSEFSDASSLSRSPSRTLPEPHADTEGTPVGDMAPPPIIPATRRSAFPAPTVACDATPSKTEKYFDQDMQAMLDSMKMDSKRMRVESKAIVKSHCDALAKYNNAA